MPTALILTPDALKKEGKFLKSVFGGRRHRGGSSAEGRNPAVRSRWSPTVPDSARRTCMRKTMVDVPTEDGMGDAYLGVPDGDGPFPGVLFFMDAFGLRPRLYEMAERIAERGYA